MRGMGVIVAMGLVILLCLACSPATANESGVVNGSAGSDDITGVINAEVVSGPSGAPEIPPFLTTPDPRTQSDLIYPPVPAPDTPPDEIGSTVGSETYVFVTKWGTYGSGDGQFLGPSGIAVDSTGNVYVTDNQNNRIQKFSSDGTFLAKWGTYGSGDGQFQFPTDIAVDSSGNVYVIDEGNRRIQKFSSSGTFISKWGSEGSGDGQFLFPSGIAVDSSGNVYVADWSTNKVQKFSETGTFLLKWGTYGSGDGQFDIPYGVAVDSSDNVYVVDNNNQRIQKFSSTGTFLLKWGSNGLGDGQLYCPYDIAVDSSNNIYVTDAVHNHRIQKFSSTGTFLTKWGTEGSGDGQFQQIFGVAVDLSGNVYVIDMIWYSGDPRDPRIQKFAPSSANLPVANFVGTPTSGNAPLTVQFIDNSTNTPTSWNWNFGDGSSSTHQFPSHTYTIDGTYTVALTVTNSWGSNTLTRTNYITVGSGVVAPVATFTGSPTSGTVPLTVTFTDSSTNTPTSWNWNFGDGSSSTLQNPSHTYSSTGTYTVSLTAINSAGSNTSTRTNYITVGSGVVAPVANFVGTPTYGTAPLTVQFIDNSTNFPTSWSWSFGDGSSSTLQFPSHTYTIDGTYTVALTVTNSGGSNTLTRTNYITVGSGVVAPVANFVGTPTSGTAPLTVQFIDNSTNFPTSWNWNFGDGSSSTLQFPSHTYTIDGTYTVALTVTNSGGSNTLTRTNYITVGSGVVAPVASFTGSPTAGTAPLTVTFTDSSTNTPTSWNWNFGDGNSSTLQNPSHTYSSTGTYTVSLTAINSAGSNTSTRTNYITVGSGVVAPVAAFTGSPTSGAAPLTVIFTDSSTNTPTSWSWNFGDSSSVNATQRNPIHTYASTGTYTVSLTATNAAGSNTSTRPSYITVSSGVVAPVANFVGTPTSGTAPLAVQFTDNSTSSPTSWNWNFGDGNSSILQNPTHIYTSVGTYTVSLTATNAAGSNTTTVTNYITVSHGTEPGPVLEWQKQLQGNINQIAMSDDGSRVIVASDNGNITAFNQNGEQLWQYNIGGSASTVSISPDGSRTAAGSSESGIFFFDQSGHLLWNYPTPSITRISLSKDVSTIGAAYNNQGIYILDNQGNLINSTSTDSGYVWDVTISSDGSRIVIGTGVGNICVFDRSGRLLWEYNTGDSVRDVYLSDDGSQIAAAAGYYQPGKVYLFDISGNLLWRNDVPQHPVAVTISPDKSTVSATLVGGEIFMFAGSGTLQWYDLLDPNRLYPDQSDVSYKILESSDSRRIFTAVDKNLYLYTNEGARVWRFSPENMGSEYIADIAISSDGSKVVAATRSFYSDGLGSILFLSTNPISPIVRFTADPTSGLVPLTVQFTDSSTNSPTSWIWNFGDVSTSTEKNPSHTYTSAGTYTVALTASNSVGSNVCTKTSYITVNAASGVDNAGVYRSGVFYRNGADAVVYGIATDTPIIGDWNGDHISEVGVYRDGVFYRKDATDIVYGLSTDTPVIGDWNGDHISEVGVYRDGVFYRNGADAIVYGLSTDTPVIGDWNGDGISEVGVYRGGVFYRNGADAIVYGISTDTPVIGDWNGDGMSEVGVFRGGVFYRNGADVIVYGLSTDTPVIGKWT